MRSRGWETLCVAPRRLTHPVQSQAISNVSHPPLLSPYNTSLFHHPRGRHIYSPKVVQQPSVPLTVPSGSVVRAQENRGAICSLLGWRRLTGVYEGEGRRKRMRWLCSIRSGCHSRTWWLGLRLEVGRASRVGWYGRWTRIDSDIAFGLTQLFIRLERRLAFFSQICNAGNVIGLKSFARVKRPGLASTTEIEQSPRTTPDVMALLRLRDRRFCSLPTHEDEDRYRRLGSLRAGSYMGDFSFLLLQRPREADLRWDSCSTSTPTTK